ncbi:MAG: TetR/AcrR family transcriptional regulator [Chloroflexi bacterium]|nr:TetR/AcrR family transcriptional regulator [Chloroflexota bacterium]
MSGKIVEKSTSDKRAAILDAALELISERGFHNTPMSLIAKTAGVSAGIIYHYFSGKEELINELYKKIKLETIRAMLADYVHDLSLKERFFGIWRGIVGHCLAYPTEHLFLEQFENSPYIKHVMGEDFMQTIAPLFSFFQQGVEEGVFKPLPPLVLFDLGFGTAVSLAKRHVAGTVVLDDELVQDTADACWDAVQK